MSWTEAGISIKNYTKSKMNNKLNVLKDRLKETWT